MGNEKWEKKNEDRQEKIKGKGTRSKSDSWLRSAIPLNNRPENIIKQTYNQSWAQFGPRVLIHHSRYLLTSSYSLLVSAFTESAIDGKISHSCLLLVSHTHSNGRTYRKHRFSFTWHSHIILTDICMPHNFPWLQPARVQIGKRVALNWKLLLLHLRTHLQREGNGYTREKKWYVYILSTYRCINFINRHEEAKETLREKKFARSLVKIPWSTSL